MVNEPNRLEKHHVAHRRLQKLAWFMDNSITLPIINKRIGVDAVIGLVPGIGDLIGAAISMVLIVYGAFLGMPKRRLLTMGRNLGVELVVGLVPFLGDVFDAFWKSNSRNARELEEYLLETIEPKPPLPVWKVWLKRLLVVTMVLLVFAAFAYGAWSILQALL